MIRTLTAAAAVAMALTAATSAHAIINSPVPDNAFITLGALDWAWADPCADVNPSCGTVDLSYQGSQGWRIPTADEMALAPIATDFLFHGANVPFGGVDPVSGAFFAFTGGALNNDGALATPYFSDFFVHGDWCNAPGSGCGFGEQPWSPGAGAQSFSEGLVVRDHVGVPEPATWAMMLMGFMGLGAMLRQRKTARAAA